MIAIGAYFITVRSIDSQKPSESIAPSDTKYCSNVCEMMSADPAAVWLAGTVNVYSGSRIDATGKQTPTARFSFVASFVITPPPS